MAGEPALKALKARSKNSGFVIALVNWKRKTRNVEAERYNPAVFIQLIMNVLKMQSRKRPLSDCCHLRRTRAC